MRDNLPEMNYRSILVFAAGVVLGALIVWSFNSSGEIGAEQAGQKVFSIVEDASLENRSVADVKELSSLYKVILEAGGGREEYFITKDGSYLVRDITDISEIEKRMKRQEQLRICLEDRGILMYGNSTSRETQYQIRLLGGPEKVDGYYRDIGNVTNMQEALENGVTVTPSFYSSGTTLDGVSSLEEISKFAGCGIYH